MTRSSGTPRRDDHLKAIYHGLRPSRRASGCQARQAETCVAGWTHGARTCGACTEPQRHPVNAARENLKRCGHATKWGAVGTGSTLSVDSLS